MKIASRVVIAIICFTASQTPGRSLYESDTKSHLFNIGDPPCVNVALHDVGRMHLTISNFGIIGLSEIGPQEDPVTGEPLPSWEFPPGFELTYLSQISLWVGAVVGRDTLVSTASGLWWDEDVHEFWPLPYPEGDIIHRSTNDPYSPEFDSAVSQQDFIAIYNDTLPDHDLTGYDNYSGRLHRPLGIEVVQRSYAWGYDYAEDFVIVDYAIGNITMKELKNVYVGLYVDNDCGRLVTPAYSWDDICGYRKIFASKYIAGLIDTLDIVWAADNDGDPDPISGEFAGYRSPTSAVATKVLRTPAEEPEFSFNWWVSHWNEEDDWGPRKIQPGGIRLFHGRLGTPLGDNNKYYMMASGEFDYNQSESFYDHSNDGWLPPPDNIGSIAFGSDIRYLLSFGPYNLKPGDIFPLTVAFVSGEQFHRGYNFTDLQMNTLWASWVFDNPGIDTDGDGYKGKFYDYCIGRKVARIDTFVISPTDTIFDTIFSCAWADTIYYAGDGVPDFRGAMPPLSPDTKLYPRVDESNRGEITIRWNGYKTETTPDQFSQRLDFEGYRVYISHSGRVNDFTLVSSYDVENYDRHELFKGYEEGRYIEYWKIVNPPYTMQLLRQLFGDDFDPSLYFNEENTLEYYNRREGKWEEFYFTSHDWNQSDYTDTTGIHKVYPDQPYPSSLNIDTARMFYPHELTEDGQYKYFEYRYVLKNLLSSVPYYITVAAFDQGYPPADIRPLESNLVENAIREFAQNSSTLVRERGLNVIVYPNPYRIDGDYRDYYEGWEEPDLTSERTRALHFSNLPHKCKISIYSIDGDLINEINHDFEEGTPGSMHDQWDLISRNEMLITSGIYYFVVESERGNQIGKFVVIY